MLTAQHRQTCYSGIPERTAGGLHHRAFCLLKKHLPPGASVLDLGSGAGAWPMRVRDGGYRVTACDLNPDSCQTPCIKVDLNGEFSRVFEGRTYDCVTLIEVIEHLENPRHVLRHTNVLLARGGILLLTTPNASGLYSRLRFFFTGQMAMFTDVQYDETGHITPITHWQLVRMLSEAEFEIREQAFNDSSFFPPRCLGDLAKIAAWGVFRPLMRGTVGGQNILIVASRREPS